MIPLLVLYLTPCFHTSEPPNLLNETHSDYGQFAGSRMQAIGEYFSELMGCGPDGWCAFRCCPPTPRASLRYPINAYGRATASRYPAASRVPVMNPTMKPPRVRTCAKACMPSCTTRCIMVVDKYKRGDQPDIEEDVRLSPANRVNCQEECMPYCTPECLSAYSRMAHRSPPKTCKAACMPYCEPECVHAPPLMTPCVFTEICHCPPGYVRCSETTCCMKYKAMAIRYKNRFTSVSFSDDEVSENDKLRNGNETSVYMRALRKMGGSEAVDLSSPRLKLPENSTIVYYPEQGKAEIRLNDGQVFVEHMDN